MIFFVNNNYEPPGKNCQDKKRCCALRSTQLEIDMMNEKFEKEKSKSENRNSAEELFADIPDMDDDDAFCQWLEEEYDREADILEEALFKNRNPEDLLDEDIDLRVSREDFYRRLKEEGLLEDTENKKKVIPMKKKNSGKKASFRLGKIVGVAGVCILCIFSATMSSEANRNYFIDTIRYLSGNDTRVVVDNDENNERVNTDEYEAIQDIEETLGVKVPEFYYRPYEMRFENYLIRENSDVAYMEYLCDDAVLSLCIDKQNINTASGISSVSGEKTLIPIHVGGEEFSIEEINDQGDTKPTYRGMWKYEEVTYYLSGKIPLEEMKKIINYMKF